jgi:enoyl-CoA hydratase
MVLTRSRMSNSEVSRVVVMGAGDSKLEHGMSTHLLLTEDGPVAVLTLNRPEKLNALDASLLAEVARVTAELTARPGPARPRVVILTGAGDKAFAAGADVAELSNLSAAEARAVSANGHRAGRTLEEAPFPVIAAVNGFALGGGCELALACDFIYASDNAKLGQPEVKLGVIPGFGGTQRLARRVGVAKTKELCMTGDPIDAAEALRIGLVDLVCPAAELMAKVKATAAKIAANGPLAVADVKRLVHMGQSMALEHALSLEAKSFGLLFATADQREGMAAFLAKPRRAAQFKGQ